MAVAASGLEAPTKRALRQLPPPEPLRCLVATSVHFASFFPVKVYASLVDGSAVRQCIRSLAVCLDSFHTSSSPPHRHLAPSNRHSAWQPQSHS